MQIEQHVTNETTPEKKTITESKKRKRAGDIIDAQKKTGEEKGISSDTDTSMLTQDTANEQTVKKKIKRSEQSSSAISVPTSDECVKKVENATVKHATSSATDEQEKEPEKKVDLKHDLTGGFFTVCIFISS